MPLPQVSKILAKESWVARIQDGMVAAFDWIRRREILDGIRVTTTTSNGQKVAITLAAGVATSIPHGLGRAALGYIVTSQTAAGTLFQTKPADLDQTLYIQLTASAAMTIELWVF